MWKKSFWQNKGQGQQSEKPAKESKSASLDSADPTKTKQPSQDNKEEFASTFTPVIERKKDSENKKTQDSQGEAKNSKPGTIPTPDQNKSLHEVEPQASGDLNQILKAEAAIHAVKLKLKNVGDATFKEMKTEAGSVTIMYMASLVQAATLHKDIILPITNEIHNVLSTFEKADAKDFDGLVSTIIDGDTILYFHQNNQAIKVKTYDPSQRAVSSSESETTVMGPQDSFTESLQTNLSLIRRRIRQPSLKSVEHEVGKETKTKISILYMENIVNEENLKTVEDRIGKIDYPGFVDATMLKQLLEDNPYSPFPTFYQTSRPDSAVLWLLDGRVLVAMDNSPIVFVCPTSFVELFFSPEDLYNRWTTASLLRILRFTGFFITIMLTPMYISALTYHPGLLPYELLIMLQESRSRVPFPPVIEVLFIELVIEVLRESGSRMPTKIGQTIGIVGGIVIGTAAVEAGLVSNTLIVLVAISALLSFLMPNFLMSNASRFVRYLFILAAGTFGLFGQMISLAWLMNHLLNLTSLGTPFMTPVIPRKWSDLYDSVIRFPLKFIKEPKGISRAKKQK